MSNSRFPVLVTLLLILSAGPGLAGDLTVDGKLVSTVPTGTPPLAVSSATMVPNLNAELLDGLPAAAFATSVGNVIRVAQTGGDYGSIQAALDSIGDAAPDNWYVILVGPGVYHGAITLKPYVSVVGHGFLETTINVEGTGNLTAVVGASLSVLSALGIQVTSTDGGDVVGYVRSGGGQPLSQVNRVRITATTSGSGHATGVFAEGTVIVTLEDTKVFVQNGSLNVGVHMKTPAAITIEGGGIDAKAASGFNYGVWRQHVSGSGSLFIRDASVRGRNGAYGYGIYSEEGRVTIEDGTVTGTGSTYGIGLLMIDGDGSVRRGRVEGSNASLNPTYATINAAYTEVDGGPFISGSGTLNCIGLYDPGMSAVSCP